MAVPATRKARPVSLMKILIAAATILLVGVLGVSIGIFITNRNLAERYIGETGKMVVSGFNTEISRMNDEIIRTVKTSQDISKLPSTIDSREAHYYPLIEETREKNRLIRAQNPALREAFVCHLRADMVIGTFGSYFRNSTTPGLLKELQMFFHEQADVRTATVRWEVFNVDEENYIIGWHNDGKIAVGCVMNLSAILNYLADLPPEYEINAVLEDAAGTRFPLDETAGTKISTKSYSYRLGTVGTLHLYVMRQSGTIRLLYILQIVLGILLLFLVLGAIVLLYNFYKVTLQLYQRQIHENQAHLGFLQEQIRPHFFLNCLSIIHSMADKRGDEEILQMSGWLSNYIRGTFQNEGNLRSIQDEIKQVQAFVKIQGKRYGEKAFHFECDVDNSLLDCRIPQLTIQTMVENSFMHAVGLDESVEIVLFVTRELVDQETFIYICVSDTGPGYSEEVIQRVMESAPIVYGGRQHIGLQNIKQRLELMYPGKARFAISNMGEHYGAVTEVWIPLKDTEDKE